MRATMSTLSAPSSATEIRHPQGESAPSRASPAPITHLPTGGCTTYSPWER